MTTRLPAGALPRAGDAPTRAPAADRLASLLDRLSASHARACAALLLLGLVLFLPGQASLQPMDRDEPRFAQASKQMLETGDFVAIRFQDEARNKKPVGIYWAQAAAVAAGEALGVPHARTQIALYRIPSLLGALGAVLLAYWAALAFLGRRDALLAAALFGACLMLNAEAHLAKTDALLTACATASLGALARVWLRKLPLPEEGGGRAVFLAFWLGLAVGILVKGPMVPLFVALPALFLSWKARSARWLLLLRPWAGLALTLILVAPWFVAITLKSGGAFYAEAVGKDILGKVGGAAERHWGPPGAYTIAFFATFWPGAAFAAMALPLAWRERRTDAFAFLIAAVLPAWLIFEAVPTKLPHYVLPLMPWLAILTVLALRRGEVDPRKRGARAVALLVPTVLALVVGDAAMATWGWRVMFLLGLAVVPVGLVIRSHLPETAGEGEDPEAAGSTAGVLRRLLRDHGRLLALTFLVIAASTVSNAVGTNMPVYAGATLGLSETAATAVPIALGLASVVFPLLGGWLADRYGRRPVMIWPRAAILVLAVPAFVWLLRSPGPAAVYAVTFLLSALSSINAAAIIVGIPESLPRSVRSTGLSLVYALSVSIFGGSTNFLINWLVTTTGDRLAPAYYLAAFSLVGTIAAMMLPETRGRDLDAEVAPASGLRAAAE